MYLRPQKKKEHRMLTIQGFVGRLFESLDEVKKQGTSSINSKQFIVDLSSLLLRDYTPHRPPPYERRSILQDCEICGMMQTAFPTT